MHIGPERVGGLQPEKMLEDAKGSLVETVETGMKLIEEWSGKNRLQVD